VNRLEPSFELVFRCKNVVYNSVTIVIEEYIESERGWGQRSDGYSVHLTMEDYKAYLAERVAAERKLNPSGDVPECYVRACGSPVTKDVEAKLYRKLVKLKKEGEYGMRVWSEKVFETNGEKKAREILEEERKMVAEQKKSSAQKRKEKIEKQALAKLTDEEKKVLGVDNA